MYRKARRLAADVDHVAVLARVDGDVLGAAVAAVLEVLLLERAVDGEGEVRVGGAAPEGVSEAEGVPAEEAG